MIRSYIIRVNDLDIQILITGVLSVTVTGLDEYTLYEVQVSAVTVAEGPPASVQVRTDSDGKPYSVLHSAHVSIIVALYSSAYKVIQNEFVHVLSWEHIAINSLGDCQFTLHWHVCSAFAASESCFHGCHLTVVQNLLVTSQ